MRGIPESVQGSKPMTSLRVKIGEKRPTNDGKYMKPVALDHFKIGHQGSGKKWIPSPDFDDTKPKEIEIELFSDNIDIMLSDCLACYAGKSRFCYNNSAGLHAKRLNGSGVYKDCTCNPNACALHEDNGREIHERWRKLYEHVDFGKKKGGDDYRTIVCKPNTSFHFLLPDPTDKSGERMLTPPGSVAKFFTTSPNSGQQIRGGLETMQELMNGKLAGLRVKLKISMITNSFGGMAVRRGLRNIDVQSAMDKLAGMSDEERANYDAAFIYEEFNCGVVEDDSAPVELIADKIERPELCSDGDFPQELLGALNLSNRDITWLEVRFGKNAAPLVAYLVETAVQLEVDITEIAQRYHYKLPDPPEPEKVPEETAAELTDKRKGVEE